MEPSQIGAMIPIVAIVAGAGADQAGHAAPRG